MGNSSPPDIAGSNPASLELHITFPLYFVTFGYNYIEISYFLAHPGGRKLLSHEYTER